jgi:acetyl-CoA synthetase
MKIHKVASFQELVERSGDDISWFTDALINYLGIQFSTPYSNVVDLRKGPAWPAWCVDGRMNIIDSCLSQYLGTPAENTPALIWEGENGESRTLSYLELSQEVCKTANALRSLGLRKGDPIIPLGYLCP